MYFTDPGKCSYCQNHGHFDEYLVHGICHRCVVRAIWRACCLANWKRERAERRLNLRSLGGGTPDKGGIS